jgi:hypothetical protein
LQGVQRDTSLSARRYPLRMGKRQDKPSQGRREAPAPAGGLPAAIPDHEIDPLDEAVALAAVGGAFVGEPDEYRSRERGRSVPIDQMDPLWAERAARAVARGDRPEDPPSVIPPLLRRAGS